MARHLLSIIAVPALVLTQIVSAPGQESDLTRIHSTRPRWQAVNDTTLDAVVKHASEHFNGLSFEVPGTPPPNVRLFADWVKIADCYKARWLESTQGLTNEQKKAARKLGHGFYLGKTLLTGYATKYYGFEKARSKTYLEREKVKKADPSIVPASQNYLLWEIATLYAEKSRNFLFPGGLADPNFREAYERYVPHGEYFGHLSEFFGLIKGRAVYKEIAMMTEATLGQQRGKVKQNPLAAQGYLLTARYELLLAEQKLRDGDVESGVYLTYNAVKHLMDARSFGALRNGVVDTFRDTLKSTETIVEIGGEQRSFRQVVLNAIDERRRSAETGRSVNVKAYIGQTTQIEAGGPEPKGDLEERVEVVKVPGSLNYKSYLYSELELLARRAAGEDTLEPTMALAEIGRILFQGMVEEIAGKGNYADLQSYYQEAMRRQRKTSGIAYSERLFDIPAPSKRLLGETLSPEGVAKIDIRERMTAFGSRLFTIPAVIRQMQNSRFGVKLKERLRAVDPPELWIDLGTLWTERARSLAAEKDLDSVVGAMDARLNAMYSYIQAANRYRDQTGTMPDRITLGGKFAYQIETGEAPSLLHLNIGATALNIYTLTLRAYSVPQVKGLSTYGTVSERLGGTTEAARLNKYREYAEFILELAREAYLTVRARGYTIEHAPEKQQNLVYTRYVDSLAGLVRVGQARYRLYETRAEREKGPEKRRLANLARNAETEARENLQRLTDTPPSSGMQFFSRGTIFEQRLGLQELAGADFCAAYTRLIQETNLTMAARALEKAQALGKSCTDVPSPN